MSGLTFATFILASFVIVIVPGPTVSLIIANSIRGGTRAGMANIAGTQTGFIVMILVVAFGLESVMTFMASWFFYIKLAGAAYLVWMGVKLLRSEGMPVDGDAVKPPRIGYFWQGFLVILSNPKVLIFLGAFIPQFIDPVGNAFVQTIIYGALFSGVAIIFDSIYAILAGKAGGFLTRARVRTVERLSGCMLIGGGIWMASLNKA